MPKFDVSLSEVVTYHIRINAPSKDAAEAWADESGWEYVVEHGVEPSTNDPSDIQVHPGEDETYPVDVEVTE